MGGKGSGSGVIKGMVNCDLFRQSKPNNNKATENKTNKVDRNGT